MTKYYRVRQKLCTGSKFYIDIRDTTTKEEALKVRLDAQNAGCIGVYIKLIKER